MSVETTAEGEVLIRGREVLGSHRISMRSEKSSTGEGNGGTHEDGGGTGERVGEVFAHHALHGTLLEGHLHSLNFFSVLFSSNFLLLGAHDVVKLGGFAFKRLFGYVSNHVGRRVFKRASTIYISIC